MGTGGCGSPKAANGNKLLIICEEGLASEQNAGHW